MLRPYRKGVRDFTSDRYIGGVMPPRPTEMLPA